MPRSVPHTFDGSLREVQLRVWERRADESFHAIAEGRYVDRCDQQVEHELEVETRWDIPVAGEPWHGLARRARDGDGAAAKELATHMIDEALETEWRDPCTSRDGTENRRQDRPAR